MTETKHKEHITSEDFGIPAEFADRAENYAAWRVQAEINTLRQQLSEALALIEASRKQQAVAWLITAAGTKRQEVQLCKPYKLLTSERVRPLYAAPVVAPDVLKELWWIRAIFAKDLKTGGAFLQNIHGKEVSKWIDRVDALGGAND